MQTAESILDSKIKELMETEGQGEYQPMDKIQASKEYAACIEAMKEYAAQACTEQRENCYDGFMNCPREYMGEKTGILNAPLPELK